MYILYEKPVKNVYFYTLWKTWNDVFIRLFLQSVKFVTKIHVMSRCVYKYFKSKLTTETFKSESIRKGTSASG